MSTEIQRLERSIEDKKLFGVCSGFGKYSETDPTIWRVALVLLFFIYPPVLVAYFLMALVMPSDRRRKRIEAKEKEQLNG